MAASLSGVVRIFLIIAGVWVLMRLMRRFLLPYLFRRAARSMAERFGAAHHAQSRGAAREPGEVTIEKVPGAKSNKPQPNSGDYVDYEVVKE